ncbi:hypothetical protein TKK_0010889 [Trichogramma kaykai]
MVYYQFTVEFKNETEEADEYKSDSSDNIRYELGGNISSLQHQSTQDRKKLLKRTRSLAVISEDDCNGCGGGSSSCGSTSSIFDSSSLQHHRRPQLIPRAKLIDRNVLKDRLFKSQQHLLDNHDHLNEVSNNSRSYCHSHSVSDIYSLPPLPDPLLYAKSTTARKNHYRSAEKQQSHYQQQQPQLPQDKFNILKWPESPRRYRSVQDLNSVTGLVDIVEDNNWPAEENRSVDCIYTQVKRKRKEHRSLDSILFEDDSDELEYFDILNLLPLSNVRLEINDAEVTNNKKNCDENLVKETSNRKWISNSAVVSFSKDGRRYFEHQQFNPETICITEVNENSSQIKNKNDNEKKLKNLRNCIIVDATNKKSVNLIHNPSKENHTSKPSVRELDDKFHTHQQKKQSEEVIRPQYLAQENTEVVVIKPNDNDSIKKQEKSNDSYITNGSTTFVNGHIEEIEETKSLWISDNEEPEDMSRRPQVLKIIDNKVTKPNTAAIKSKKQSAKSICTNSNDSYIHKVKTRNCNESDKSDHIGQAKSDTENNDIEKKRFSVEIARTFFENNNSDNDQPTANSQLDGRLEKIIKETSSMIGKACNVVKGSLGFEAGSESSDLGIGSEIGSDDRRLSVDDCTLVVDHGTNNQCALNDDPKHSSGVQEKNQKNYTNLTRSISCIDSIECQDINEPEFDHVRYKIVKSNMFGKSIINNSKNDVNYGGLMHYLRKYSFQDLLTDNKVVIIEPVRAEVERKCSFNESKLKSTQNCRVKTGSLDQIRTQSNEDRTMKSHKHFIKAPRQSSLRKHFFYQPIRVNRELNDEELPDPDTVKNVRRMFEETLRKKLEAEVDSSKDYSSRKSVSMKDLRTIENNQAFEYNNKAAEVSRSRCSSRAKDLTKLFENLEKIASPASTSKTSKDDIDIPRNESKARLIAQSFEAKSGRTSPSNSNSSKIKLQKYNQQPRLLHNWDSGSVSSGVSSDYPDTDPGSAQAGTSSEDEDLYYQDDEIEDERYEGHYVSQDVLKKIREYGTSVTYYGGKVVNTCNGPLICPMVCKKMGMKKPLDHIKFRLVKSNSCDSRLELTGRVVQTRNKFLCNRAQEKRRIDLRQLTIDETPSIELTAMEQRQDSSKTREKNDINKEEKRKPPEVIGLELKKEENSTNFKADFKLGKFEDTASVINRFAPSALTRWQVNDSNAWRRINEFGKMEFEEFEVLEDSLNG